MEVARHWRLRKQRYTLPEVTPNDVMGPLAGQQSMSAANGAVLTMQAERVEASRVTTGEVYSWTTVFNPPFDFEEQAPYFLAMIRMDDGALLTAQLTDLDEEPQIGMRVEMVTRKLRTDGPAGMIIYGYKFRKNL